jgi:hypothetical protein
MEDCIDGVSRVITHSDAGFIAEAYINRPDRPRHAGLTLVVVLDGALLGNPALTVSPAHSGRVFLSGNDQIGLMTNRALRRTVEGCISRCASSWQ